MTDDELAYRHAFEVAEYALHPEFDAQGGGV